ncbi:MAG: GyrI-like domain-containing protein [Micrococcales bacterium]|nr:GyrI-like domain-containing protein [Micrococcales bacterium]
MSEPSLVTLEPAEIAVVREVVAMDALPAFYDRAYHEAMAAIQQQGATVGGPPVGVYFGMPTDTVDVAAGFPTPTPVQPVGAVSALQLPGGRAVQVLHIGSYDSMQQTYGGLMQWVQAQGLALGPLMWETYLTEPDDKDPGSMQTLITWPLA